MGFTPRIVALSLNDRELQKKKRRKRWKAHREAKKAIRKNLKNCLLTLNFKSKAFNRPKVSWSSFLKKETVDIEW